MYRASDTRLQRTVAIKVLPPHLRASPAFHARFAREARTISQLTHPHICTLHDIGREGEIDFLVMEQFEVYVTAFPSGQGRCQISTEGGREVVWARSGRELYWRRDKTNTMMAAEIDAETGCSETRPKALFSGYLPGVSGLPGYDSTRDGRLLMLKGASADSTPTEPHVVLNWFEELRNKSRADQATMSR